MTTYQHPANGYIVTGSDAASWLWCLLFGPLYFLCKGNIVHALISLVLGVITHGVSWVIYPLFVYAINDRYYQSRGWIKIKSPESIYSFNIMKILGK